MPPTPDPSMIGLDFWLLIGALIVGVVMLLLMYRNSLRRERRKRYSAEEECSGALIARNDVIKGQEYLITEEGLVLGRVPDVCDVLCGNLAVSREHAKVYAAAGRVIVVDLGSKNGTYVNGFRVVQEELTDGDIVTLGRKRPTTLEFRR